MKRSFASLVVLCSLFLSPGAFPQGATLSGVVRNGKGQPVVGAKIALIFESSSPPLKAFTETRDSGLFVIWGLPQGEYSYAVEAEGYARSEGERFSLTSDAQSIEVVLEPLPSRVEPSPVPDRSITDLRLFSRLQTVQPDSLLVMALPGLSFKVLTEPGRPFAGFSTDALVTQFNQLLNQYRDDERKADLRVEKIVSTLAVRNHVDASVKQKLRRFDEEYETHFSAVRPPVREEYPRISSDSLRRSLDLELGSYSHWYETLSRLRATVAELVRRHAFDAGEARSYLTFLMRNGLAESEFTIRGFTFIEAVSYDAVAILSFQRDLESYLKGLSSGSRVLLSHSGIALGFLEADPAKDTQELEPEGSTSVSRRFEPIIGNMTTSEGVLRINLKIDSDPPSGVRKEMLGPGVQTIVSNGELQPALWKINLYATKAFKPFKLRVRAQLEEYVAGRSIANPQPIVVPIPVVSIEPGPTRWQKAWAIVLRYLPISGVLGFVLGALTVYFGGADRLRQFLVGTARKILPSVRNLGSAARQELNRLIRAVGCKRG